MTLRFRALRAMAWVALARYLAVAASYLTQLLLARLLAPEEFGLVAICFVVLNTMQIFQDMGLGQTLIARRDCDEYDNPAFFISFSAGMILSVALLLFAPQLASFFSSAALAPLLRATSVRLIVMSLATVPSALLQRNLRFKTLAWPKLIGTIGFVVVALPTAFAGFGAWSMVWASVVQAILETALVWRLSNWRPAWSFEMSAALEMFGYSKPILVHSLGAFLQSNLDTIIVAKAMGTTPVGYYNLAFTLGNALPLLVMNAAFPVLLPSYSQLEDQPERLQRAVLRVIKYTLLILTPLAVVVALLARDVIMAFYGSTWQEAIVPLQILCLYGFIRQGTTPLAPLFVVKNKVWLLNLAIYPNLVLLPLLALPAIRVAGLTGMTFVMVAIIFFCNAPVFIACGRILSISLTRYAVCAIVPLSAAIVSGAILLGGSRVFGLQVTTTTAGLSAANVILLGGKAVLFLACYAALALIADAELRHDLMAAGAFLVRGEALKSLAQD